MTYVLGDELIAMYELMDQAAPSVESNVAIGSQLDRYVAALSMYKWIETIGGMHPGPGGPVAVEISEVLFDIQFASVFLKIVFDPESGEIDREGQGPWLQHCIDDIGLLTPLIERLNSTGLC